MYLVGAQHPHKDASRLLLERAIARGERLLTDSEVLQEILHRYSSIGRRDAIQPAFDALLAVVDHVYPVEQADLMRTKTLMLNLPQLSARDALHVAIMQRYQVEQIMSFDAGFDSVSGVHRLC